MTRSRDRIIFISHEGADRPHRDSYALLTGIFVAILIQGTAYGEARAVELATERFNDSTLRKKKPSWYFDAFCLNHVISALSASSSSYISTGEFLTAVLDGTTAAHQTLETLKADWRGRTRSGFCTSSTIEPSFKDGVVNLINNKDPAPGADRGKHTTCPCLSGSGSFREFSLKGKEGRMTTRNHNGRIGYYYSTHHAAATYEYLLICDNSGRPVLRGTGIGIGKPIMLVPYNS